MGLQGLLVGGLEGVVQVLCFSAEVTVKTPVAPRGDTQLAERSGSHGAPTELGGPARNTVKDYDPRFTATKSSSTR